MKSSKPEILFGIFCETIRAEKSGQVTPIGIWGESCVIESNPPAVFPTLGFYAYIRNPKRRPYLAKFHMSLPGNPVPVEIEVPVGVNASQTGQNLIFNCVGVSITGPGDVVVKLHLDTSPPTEKEFRLSLAFRKKTAVPSRA